LSKGKAFVTVKQLRKWDELVDTVEAGFLDWKTVDEYIAKLNAPNGRVDLEIFKEFMALMDRVLVDGNGDFLGLDEEGLAVDLDGIEDDEDE